MKQCVKIIDTNGQISFGKKLAGRPVYIKQINEGTWIIKIGDYVPSSELWIHQIKHLKKLNRALVWASKNTPKNNFNQFVDKVKKSRNNKIL